MRGCLIFLSSMSFKTNGRENSNVHAFLPDLHNIPSTFLKSLGFYLPMAHRRQSTSSMTAPDLVQTVKLPSSSFFSTWATSLAFFTSNELITCFHESWIYELFSRNFIFHFLEGCKVSISVIINSYIDIFYLNRKILPCLKRKQEKFC